MATSATFLHITDTHLGIGSSSDQVDLKLQVSGIKSPTRVEALSVTAILLSQRLKSEGRRLDGILFTGDAQDRSAGNGHALLRETLVDALRDVMKEHWRFVATPGNHDIPQGKEPGSPERYKNFADCWRNPKNNDVAPWLDGIDSVPISGDEYCKYRFLAPDKSWAIYPINSCNWSHTQISLPKSVEEAFDQLSLSIKQHIPDMAPELIDFLSKEIRTPVEKQLLYDMARVSQEQLAAIKPIMAADSLDHRSPLRIALLHHHLNAPSMTEEVKPFSDITNLNQLRTYLRQNKIDIVIHGHKHVESINYDYIQDHSLRHQVDPRRILVVSGGTYSGYRDESSMRLIDIAGLPGAPRVEVEQIPLGRLGFDLPKGEIFTGRLWRTNGHVAGGPVVIHGTDINDVYARAVRAASEEANKAMLIVHLDLPLPDSDAASTSGGMPFPNSYPDPEKTISVTNSHEIASWAGELVSWWQLPRSSLELRIPYIHGTRLRRFAGQLDQVKRIVSLLNSSGGTSRALAVLIDPVRDFDISGVGEDFASFCLVQFRRRQGTQPGNHLDCTAYYRAQEFKHWWPINVAELRSLQIEVASKVNCTPGRITTIAADARAVTTRSPGQVAVPIIDRWLDQAPSKLMALACQLCGDTNTSDSNIIKEWHEYLRMQRMSADPAAFNPDGVPVAVDSLELLAAYIEVRSSPSAAEVLKIAGKLKTLARENRNYERSQKDRDQFNDWALGVQPLCDELLALTSVATPDISG